MTGAGRFDGIAGGYEKFRPSYPESLAARVCAAILDDRSPKAGAVVDVGCGTGIFTRQMRACLPETIDLIGIDPSPDMLDAARAGPERIRWIAGTAEALPLADRSARAITAATAAHWFDRPAFYAETMRVLHPGGVIAIAEYVRDARVPAVAAIEDFLRDFGPKAYQRPDYPDELAGAGFRDVESISKTVDVALTLEQTVGLGLSSSHARPAMERLGRQGAADALAQRLSPLLQHGGRLNYRYLFQLFLARCG